MKKTAAVFALLILLVPALCLAQEKGPTFSFSFMKPSMENTKMLNSAMLFGFDYPLNENLTVSAYIPYAMFQPDVAGLDTHLTKLMPPEIGKILKALHGLDQGEIPPGHHAARHSLTVGQVCRDGRMVSPEALPEPPPCRAPPARSPPPPAARPPAGSRAP